MNKKRFNVAVSVKDNNAKIVQGIVQNDSGNLMDVYMTDGTEPFDYTGYSAITVTIKKPDGTLLIDAVGANLDTVDATAGLVAFTLPIECVTLTGMHYISISVYGSGHMITTARLNYYVSGTDSAVDSSVKSDDNYPVLNAMITKLSEIDTNEIARQTAEALRVGAEAGRVDTENGIVANVNTIYAQMQAIQRLIEEYKTAMLSAAAVVQDSTKTFDLSTVYTKSQVDSIGMDFGTLATATHTMQIRRGLAAEITALAAGELGYATDTAALYIGTASGNVQINPVNHCFITSATAPTDTTKLWIDTANGNALKFYNGTEWTAANTAVFS